MRIPKFNRIFIFSGTREGVPDEFIEEIVNKYEIGTNDLVIEGYARGVDSQAYEYTKEIGANNLRVPANWRGQDRKAGPLRNGFMINIAFALMKEIEAQHNFMPEYIPIALPSGNSVGTNNFISLSTSMGKEPEVYNV